MKMAKNSTVQSKIAKQFLLVKRLGWWVPRYQGKAVRGKLRTAAAVLADWHGRSRRESHADRMGGKRASSRQNRK